MSQDKAIFLAIEDGRHAARQGLSFDNCPFTYKNSKCRSVAEYNERGYPALRDKWFEGWNEIQGLKGLK